MEAFIQLIQLLMSGALGVSAQQKYEEYRSAVDRQIAEGRIDYAEAMQQTMRMLDNDPNFAQARQVLDQQHKDLSDQLRQSYADLAQGSETSRQRFLRDYDARTGTYLRQNDLSTANLLRDVGRTSRGISADYASQEADITGKYGQRETDVMGLLEGQGEQALEDTRRTYGEQAAQSLGDLASRGLSGSGVGASIRAGFAGGETDQLARIREAVAAQKAGTMATLRGDTLAYQERAGGNRLAFGERAMNLGAGLTDTGINRRMQGAAQVQNARANLNAAMRAERMAIRERGITGASTMDYETGQNLTNYLSGLGGYRVNTYRDQTNTGLGWLYGSPIQYMPPDTSWMPQYYSQVGAGTRSSM